MKCYASITWICKINQLLCKYHVKLMLEFNKLRCDAWWIQKETYKKETIRKVFCFKVVRSVYTASRTSWLYWGCKKYQDVKRHQAMLNQLNKVALVRLLRWCPRKAMSNEERSKRYIIFIFLHISKFVKYFVIFWYKTWTLSIYFDMTKACTIIWH